MRLVLADVSWVDAAQVAAFFLAGLLPTAVVLGRQISELRKEVAILSSQMAESTHLYSMWPEFVDGVNCTFLAVANRMEWHLGLIDRLWMGDTCSWFLKDGEIVREDYRDAAVRIEREMSRNLQRHLAELDLYSSDRATRVEAARVLSESLGDSRSLARMCALEGADGVELKRAIIRLTARLDEPK